MKFFIAVAVAVSYAYEVSLSDSCSCGQLQQQVDCVGNPNCQWSNGCLNVNCSSITTQIECNWPKSCAWVNNTCSTFTKCSDYSSNTNVTCFEYGDGSISSNNSTQCQDRITPQSFNGTCSQFSSSPLSCNGLLNVCIYSGTTCRDFQCSDHTNSTSCQNAHSLGLNRFKVCSWSGTECAESNTSTLNSTTCYYMTMQTYSWNPSTNACVQCSSNASSTSSTNVQGSSYSYKLLAGLLSVLII